MFHKRLFGFLEMILGSGVVYAHCDIPCGIYTTEPAKTAAKTVVAMVKKIQDEDKTNVHNIARFVDVKEKHAQICKDEVLILWSDFFKEEHLEKEPELHSVVWKAVKLCSNSKRTVDLAEAERLLSAVEEVDRMFQALQS